LNIAKVNAVLLLRNENFASSILVQLIGSQCFNNLITKDTNDKLEEISNRICLVLCHFCHVKNILPSHQSLLSNIILPDLLDLKNYLKREKQKLNDLIQKYAILNLEETELLARGFPNYEKILNLPKNSYMYDYYISGKLEEVLINNHVSENNLWHSMKDLRYLMNAIYPLFQMKQNMVIVNAFQYCNKKINERFFKISN
jgi:hypothetical protein